MRLTLLLSCVTVLLVLSAASGAQSEKCDRHDRRILERLRDRFRGFRENQQYVVLYTPPPNNRRGQVTFVPTRPNYDNQRGTEFYPRCNANDGGHASNYAVAIPHYGDVSCRNPMNRRGKIHTEDFLINVVWPNMLRWYRAQYHRGPRIIYIFTHFLPCQACFEVIQQLHNRMPNVAIYVGFSELYGEKTLARRRLYQLKNFLVNAGGDLFQLWECTERGRSARSKREVSDTCRASTQGRKLVISMDFSSGKAVVYFSGLTSAYYGWFGLYNRKGERQTWEYSNSATAGKKVFSSGYGYLSEGYEVRYFAGYYESDLSLTSYKWDSCGFGWEKLNNLPSSHGDSYITLEVNDGSPVIVITISNFGATSSWDWVCVQAIDQTKSNTYWSYQWVAYLAEYPSNVRRYVFNYGVDYSLSKGFRLKYVYYDSKHGYQWKEMYDNASPIWTPDGCRVG